SRASAPRRRSSCHTVTTRAAAEMSAGVVTELRATPYAIPTSSPEADGTKAWDSTTLVLVTAHCDGVVGTGWTYGPAACAQLVTELLAGVVEGRDALAVTGSWQAMV